MTVDEPEQEYEDPRNVRVLKRVVYIMSVMLVVGAIVVIGTIIYRAMNYDPIKAANSPIRPAFPALDVAISQGAQVGSIEMDGNRMAVHVVNKGTNEILIIDIRRGTLLGRVKLTN
jgi:hypothetical protein